MSELRKPFLKKISSKNLRNEINVKMPSVNKKPLARNGNLVKTKKTRPRMHYEWIGKTNWKKSDPKN